MFRLHQPRCESLRVGVGVGWGVRRRTACKSYSKRVQIVHHTCAQTLYKLSKFATLVYNIVEFMTTAGVHLPPMSTTFLDLQNSLILNWVKRLPEVDLPDNYLHFPQHVNNFAVIEVWITLHTLLLLNYKYCAHLWPLLLLLLSILHRDGVSSHSSGHPLLNTWLSWWDFL